MSADVAFELPAVFPPRAADLAPPPPAVVTLPPGAVARLELLLRDPDGFLRALDLAAAAPGADAAIASLTRALDARLAYISELAANVSHEFKTPIAAVRGAAELLRDGAADDPVARRRFLDNILADAARLSALVTRLLELSRVESRVESRVPFDYRALATAVVARYPAASLAWRATVDHARAAPEQVETVLTNLLDNATRFSPEGAGVTVAVEGDAHGFHTTVADRGAGISAANRAQVWDRFFTTARAEGGTGLGLAIVRAIVEGHGGEVGVESREGEGSAFWFTLPRRL